VRLVPLLLQLERRPGPLRPQILAALAAHGRPLRWAITAATADITSEAPPDSVAVTRLQIEAVVLA
jgi:hypothetical protein